MLEKGTWLEGRLREKKRIIVIEYRKYFEGVAENRSKEIEHSMPKMALTIVLF